MRIKLEHFRLSRTHRSIRVGGLFSHKISGLTSSSRVSEIHYVDLKESMFDFPLIEVFTKKRTKPIARFNANRVVHLEPTKDQHVFN